MWIRLDSIKENTVRETPRVIAGVIGTEAVVVVVEIEAGTAIVVGRGTGGEIGVGTGGGETTGIIGIEIEAGTGVGTGTGTEAAIRSTTRLRGIFWSLGGSVRLVSSQRLQTADRICMCQSLGAKAVERENRAK